MKDTTTNTEQVVENNSKINISLEEVNIEFTKSARAQLELILQNDYTLTEQVFRLQISGKGCHGFDYSIGFTEPQIDDMIYLVHGCALKLSIDPFTAFYCKDGTIDYVLDHNSEAEGFSFENSNQKNYRGKFFKKEETLPI